MADNARDFSGSSQFISITDPTGIVVDDAWTVGLWVAPDTAAVDGNGLVKVGDAGGRTRGVDLAIQGDGGLRLTTQAGSFADGASDVGTAGTWRRVGARKAGSGTSQIIVVLDGSDDGNNNLVAPTEITTGDVFRASESIGGAPAHYDGKMAWLFWLQGVALTAAALDGYLNDPQSLIDDYGPAGTVTADALKIFWPMQCDNATEEDESGVGNDGAYTGPPTLVATGPTPTTTYDPCAAAPTLSSPTGAADGATAADGTVSTDTGDGTLYWVVSTSETAPSVAQIQAGNDSSGSAAAASGNQSVSATGVQNVSATGLTAETTYYFHYQQQDAATNDSTVASSTSFTTAAAATTSDAAIRKGVDFITYFIKSIIRTYG